MGLTAIWNLACTLLIAGSMNSMLLPGSVEAYENTNSTVFAQTDTSGQQGSGTSKNHLFSQQYSELPISDSSSQSFEGSLTGNDEIFPNKETIQLTQVYRGSISHPEENLTTGQQISSVQSSRVQVILIGGLFLTIGTIFIPLLLPQLHIQNDHGKFSHAVGKTYKSILRRYLSLSLPFLGSDNKTIPRNLPSCKEVDLVAHKYLSATDSSVPDTRTDLTSLALCSQAASVVKTTKAFFLQSGFECIEYSQTGLLITSTQPQYKHYGKIAAFIMKDQSVLDSTSIQTLYEIIQTRENYIDGGIAFVVAKEPPCASAYQQIYRYRSYNDITIIPIHQRRMEKSIRQATCAQTLENIVRLSLENRNLYDQDDPIEDPFNVFGRHEILTRLLDAVSHLQHIGIFGLRKIGKTSFIWQFREYLAHHIVAYIDLQHLPADCTDIYRIILEECVRDALFKYPHVTLPELWITGSEDTKIHSLNFMEDLVKIWDCLKSHRHDLKVILLLDEVEQLVPGETESTHRIADFSEFIETLREISSRYEFLVSVMISSSPEVSRIEAYRGQNNSDFHYYKEIFLSSLSEDGCNQMICNIGSQMGLTYTEESLSRIYYETGGHPYVTRQLCRLIAQNLRNQIPSPRPPDSTAVADNSTIVKVKDIENAVSAYIAHELDYLESVWQQLSPTAREVLSIVTTNASCTLEELINDNQDYDIRRKRRKAIAALVENKIIEKCEQKYSITMGLFERFILTIHQGDQAIRSARS